LKECIVIIVDAHEDIAWNMLALGRDYSLSVKESRARESGSETAARRGEVLLGWPDWREGNVALTFGTLYAPPEQSVEAWETVERFSDPESAHRLYWKNIDTYRRLFEEHPDKFRAVESQTDLDQVLQSWDGDSPQLGIVMLMEGADGIRQPEELELWYEAGVRLIGPAWTGTRYAGGTGIPGPFSDLGWRLLDRMADLGMGLDISHLAEAATHEALDRFPGTLFASHSNPRAIVGETSHPDRHLADDVIRALAERDSVLGVVLYNRFLKGDWQRGDRRDEITLDLVLAHIDHICQLTGSAAHVGIGSDFDGNVGRQHIPQGLDSIADLRLIGPALLERGYDETDVEAIMGQNWMRILRRTLPES
jgi:membrane dipeptidase